jgi:hypothetical protein
MLIEEVEKIVCTSKVDSIMTLFDSFGFVVLGEYMMYFCYSSLVGMIQEKKVGIMRKMKWTHLLLKREAVLGKIVRQHGEEDIGEKDQCMYIVSSH